MTLKVIARSAFRLDINGQSFDVSQEDLVQLAIPCVEEFFIRREENPLIGEGLSSIVERRILMLILMRERIMAIKLIRSRWGYGLKEAKDLVEKIEEKHASIFKECASLLEIPIPT
jgi:ribosomal protein L7/L12